MWNGSKCEPDELFADDDPRACRNHDCANEDDTDDFVCHLRPQAVREQPVSGPNSWGLHPGGMGVRPPDR